MSEDDRKIFHLQGTQRPMPPDPHASRPSRRQRIADWVHNTNWTILTGVVIFCTFVCVLAIGALLLASFRSEPPSEQPTVAAGTTERDRIVLEDGSVVDLHAGTRLEVKIDAKRRRVYLFNGRARFHVAKDPKRPFDVVTNEVTAKAVGTVFDVVKGKSGTRVAVVEGKVLVTHVKDASSEVSVLLKVGQQTDVTPIGDVWPGITGAGALEIPKRRVTFKGKQMDGIVAEINRHHPLQIVIADPRVANMRFDVAFDLDDRAAIITILENQLHVRAITEPDGSTTLHWQP